MKIKKLNSLYKLIEGLDKNFDFAQADINIQSDGSREQDRNAIKNIQSIIEEWDPKGLTNGFRSLLIERFAENGINSGDNVIQWLTLTKDDNIKSLDVNSAKTLFKLLDDRDLEFNDPYILEENNLFTGSSKDISYKLNALSMILDPMVADKYKNKEGISPTIDLMQSKDGNFFDANQIRKNLDGFVNEKKGNGDEVPFLTWIRIVGKAPKGKEWALFKRYISSLYRGNQYKELRAAIFSDLRGLSLNHPQKLKNLGAFKVPKNGTPQILIPLIVEAIQNKEYDIIKGNNKLVLDAIMANLNDKMWDHDEQISSPKNLQQILNTFLKEDSEASKYEGLIKILVSQQDLITKFLNSTVPNTKLDELIKFIKKFINNNIKFN